MEISFTPIGLGCSVVLIVSGIAMIGGTWSQRPWYECVYVLYNSMTEYVDSFSIKAIF